MLGVFKRELWTKELTSWYLFDFANSFISINMIVYFSQWVVVDHNVSDFWFALPAILATLVLVFLSTHFGRKGDIHGSHYPIFRNTTLLVFIVVLGLVLAGRTLSYGAVVVPLILFGCYQFFFQLALVPYNAFIKHISSKEDYGKVSGLGFTFGNAGMILGLLITLPVINGSITFFGNDRLAPLIPGLIVFFLFSLPSLIVFSRKRFLKEPIKEEPAPFFKSFWNNLKKSREHPGVFPLLLSFYFFSDAITTLSLYSAIYLQRVFLLPDSFKVKIFILVFAGVVLGAFFGGMLSDKFSHKKILILSLFFEAVTIFIIALNTNAGILTLIFFLFGLAMGVVYASSRSYLASLIPVEESGTFFGLYTFAERFASVIGPAVWGIIIFGFSTLAPANYRIAAFVMGVLVLAAAIPLLKIKKLPQESKSF